jgi:hypothetical protein
MTFLLVLALGAVTALEPEAFAEEPTTLTCKVTWTNCSRDSGRPVTCPDAWTITVSVDVPRSRVIIDGVAITAKLTDQTVKWETKDKYRKTAFTISRYDLRIDGVLTLENLALYLGAGTCIKATKQF